MVAERKCDGCGTTEGIHTWIGRALLCRHCEVKVKTEIERLHQEGKPVNALKIAMEMQGEVKGGRYMRVLTKQELNLRYRLTNLLRGVQNEIAQKAFDECYLMQEDQKRYAEFSPNTLIRGRHVILLNHDFFESSQEECKVYVVFHEIAHSFKRHTGEEDKRQEEEKEAYELAKQWTAEWKKLSGT